jgi:tetratricopeptide (TPR) repeat protein
MKSVVGILLVVGIASPGIAQPLWESNRGNCEDVLPNPGRYDIGEVRTCAQLWESYRDVADVSRSDAQGVAAGFSMLYHEGTRSDRRLAQTALGRLGIEMMDRDTVPSGSDSGGSRATTNLDRSTIHVGESSRRARRRASDDNSDGMEQYQRGNYRAAASEFEDALRDDPWHVLAKYNLACQYSLLGDTEASIDTLNELSRWDHGDIPERMARARVDEDFISIRDDPRFRIITGYLRAQLLNGAGDAGDDRIEEIHDAMIAEGIDVASYGYDRHARARPIIYYRQGFDEAAQTAERIIAHDLTVTRLLDWDSDYDLVVTFGTLSWRRRFPFHGRSYRAPTAANSRTVTRRRRSKRSKRSARRF